MPETRPTQQTDELATDGQQSVIGRTSATDRVPSTSDKFSFWLGNDVIVNPFDIVEVPQVNHPPEPSSRTYGLVTTLEHRTDAPSHLANFVSNNFGELDQEPNTRRLGATVAHTNVLSNDGDIYMPVGNEQPVRFASPEGIERALGIDAMRPADRVPAGLISMSNGASTVAYIDRRYVLGPDGAHVNISGISGLATKTSYAMFLIQSLLQKAEHPEEIAVIILNVKQADLLQIDRPGPPLPPEEMAKWEALGLEPRPFDNVHYLLPRSTRGDAPNSFMEPPGGFTTYAYDLEAAADKLDMLFTNVSDPSGTMDAIIGDIMIGVNNHEGEFRDVYSWDNLLNGPPLFRDGKTAKWGDHHAASVGKFRRHLRRLVRTRQTGIFVDARAKHERVLATELAKLQGGHTYVIDIAKLHDEEQTLVFGDLLRTVYELKAEPPEDRSTPIPERIIFFVDELNKYAPSGHRTSPITEQVLDIAERGRSLGVILISAQQFMSAVHGRVTGNAATKILGRTGSSEVYQPDYRFLDDDLKLNMTRLSQGELIISHNVYRQPVKVVFPRPAYQQKQF